MPFWSEADGFWSEAYGILIEGRWHSGWKKKKLATLAGSKYCKLVIIAHQFANFSARQMAFLNYHLERRIHDKI
jgi:hypothetical protein